MGLCSALLLASAVGTTAVAASFVWEKSETESGHSPQFSGYLVLSLDHVVHDALCATAEVVRTTQPSASPHVA